MDDKFQKLVRGERDFLHDLSNHLVVGQGMGSIILNKLKKIEDLDPKIVEKMGKVQSAVEKMTALVKERRANLIAMSEEDAEE